ncbi:MAG: branched-chain amino acid ABC transporter permease [Desulfobulbus propionicus]|nr:MAG: branched-chain amino acid ABC transporter permease [Desulfobulbus propionicus]PIE60767.1 MAG: branched-chain amino acid ABC transporter permease [Desulfobulbus propionicus]
MLSLKDFKNGLIVSLWFVFLTFPLLVVKINPVEHTVLWRWNNMLLIAGASFFVYLASRFLLARKHHKQKQIKLGLQEEKIAPILKLFSQPKFYIPLAVAVLLFLLIFPYLFSTYQVNIMITALMYVVLGLGLNIVVGVAGLLDLGYVAFYAVGAYAYALLNMHFDLGFWIVLPIGGLLGALFGLLLGFPVLRLRGDYLAIVTLGFGEIIRLVLENWGAFSQGPSGISNIDRPALFGIELSLNASINYMYYLTIIMVIFTIFVVNRLQDSRIGRAWFALKEDEIACQAMGIDKMKTKLTAFALGATWAGMAGVMFAAKTTFINPASFTFLESAIILCIVVLGGMGSIPGVIIGALVLILLPEYLRAFSDYRMLVFGAVLVVMMVFRPQGLFAITRRTYSVNK